MKTRRFPQRIPGNRRSPYFALLSRADQAQAIRKLVASGQTHAAVATTIGIPVEELRSILAAHS